MAAGADAAGSDSPQPASKISNNVVVSDNTSRLDDRFIKMYLPFLFARAPWTGAAPM
jgi:hypothetical protein